MNIRFEDITIRELDILNAIGCRARLNFNDRTLELKVPEDKPLVRIIR